jgi:WD40 repeat protein/tRNA A-37 threonylcarbamoyl transferase component Bud32
MTAPDEPDRDDEFARLLAEYDEALAQGQTPPPASDTPGDLGQQLVGARACLDLLEYAWPRQRPAAGPGLSLVDGLQQLGRFQLRRELGRGGHGMVFLAFDPLLRRDVAVKVARPEVIVTDELRHRFRREAHAAARLNHPNLVPIYEVGNVGPLCYLVTAYCPGPTLAAWLREQAALVPVAEAARLVAELAEAVAYMHGQGILHRDIKPGNILLASGGRKPPEVSTSNSGDSRPPLADCTPRLTDFGLAKLTEDATQHTRTGSLLGTPAYMAPEQADARLAEVGPPTDVHALGLVLYEVLTGRSPYRSSNDIDTVQQVLSAEPLPPRRLRRDVPRDLETICLKCLEKDPDRRYATAALLAVDLRAFLAGEPIRARPAGAWQRAAKWARRRPAVAALTGVTAAALLSLAIWALWYTVKLHEHTTELQNALNRAESGERRLRDENYAIQIKLADTMRADDPAGLLSDLLNGLRPGPEQQDLRGFEWFYLWNLAKRELHLRGHRAPLEAVAISSDGKRCASGDGDGTLRLWDLRTGASLGEWAGHTVAVHHMAFSRDGSRLATAADNRDRRELIFWDVVTMKEVARLDDRKRSDGRVAVQPGGELIAFAAYDDDLARHVQGIWNPQTGEVRHLSRELDIQITALQFSPDGRTLAGARYYDCYPLCWDLKSGELREFDSGQKRIDTLAFSPDGKFLASGDWEGNLKIWDVLKAQVHATREFKDGVKRAAFSPDGKILAIATGSAKKWSPESAELTLWNWSKGDRRPEVLRPGCYMNALAFSPDSQTIALGCSDRHVHLWRPFAENPVSTLTVRGTKEAWSIAFAPDSQTLAVGYDDEAGRNQETLRLWDVRTGRELASLQGHDSMVSEVAFLADGRTLASASYDKAVKLWDVPTRKLAATLNGAAERLRCLAASPDGRLLAAAGWENNVHVWDITTGRECQTLPGDHFMNRVAFAPDSKFLVSADFTGALVFWDLATGLRVGQRRDYTRITSLAYTPNGLSLATANGDGIVKLWDLAGDPEPTTLIGHKGEARALAFSPDGKTLATGGEDRTVRLWQAATGRELLVFKDLPQKVNSVAFSPDGSQLAAALHDGSVLVWHAPRGD